LNIEKRKYRDGYHVEWLAKSKKISQKTIPVEKVGLKSDSEFVTIALPSSFSSEKDAYNKQSLIKRESQKEFSANINYELTAIGMYTINLASSVVASKMKRQEGSNRFKEKKDGSLEVISKLLLLIL
jgi:hypothetical protein